MNRHNSSFCVLFFIISIVLPMVVNADEPDSGSRPSIVAHRGLLKHAPENTLANFRACLELRLGFELDVRRSKDGHLVCVHDGTVDRTTNGRGNVVDLTLKELKKLDAGSWFHSTFRGERVPTIDEIFALLADYPQADVLIAVDLKGADIKLEGDTVALAKKHKVLDRLLFIGRAISEPDVRKRLRIGDTRSHIGSVANNSDELEASIQDPNADWVYVRFVPTKDEVARIRKVDKRMFIAGSTVASLQQKNWRTVARLGIDAILTDYPLELRQQLRSSTD